MTDKILNAIIQSAGAFSSVAGPAEMRFILSLGFTLLLAGLMAITYRFSHDVLSYNRKFNIALVMLAFISAVLLDLVQSNPLLSLGVMGSLSICRIRMNTKDPRDLGFVFWALSIGIAAATGAYLAGTMCAVILAGLLLITGKRARPAKGSVIVVRGENPQMKSVEGVFRQLRRADVQSKNIFRDTFEFVYELQLREREEEKLIRELRSIKGIHGVNVLAPETRAE